MSNNKFTGSFASKGYYIALILCAAAIGISGYLYYRNLTNEDPTVQDPTVNVDVQHPSRDDIQVVGPDDLPSPGIGDDGETDQVVATEPSEDTSFKTCSPLAGETVADYAMDCLAYNATTRDWRTHNGIDIAAEAGTAVCAAADGTVYTVYSDDTMGMTVVLRHENGYVTVYSSLSQDVPVSAGDTVKMGQTIGYVGNTTLLETAIGDHLHFAVTCDGAAVDPAAFLSLE